MSFIELYSIPNADSRLKMYNKSNDSIIGSLLINKSTIELDITNNSKNGKIIGNANTDNILNKGNYKLIVTTLLDDFVNHNVHVVIDTNIENIIRIFIYYIPFELNLSDNQISGEPWLFFCDSDKDDLYSLTILVAQNYLKKINLIGIVCDIGFFDNFIDAVSMTNFWINDILKVNIPIYIGANRPEYLNGNLFPTIWTESYVKEMEIAFNYIPSKEFPPNTQPFDSLILSTMNYEDHSIKIFSSGSLTSVAASLVKYSWFNSKIKKCVSMVGNYEVPGNVPPFVDPTANSEYNAYINPSSLQIVTNTLQDRFHIVPLDCTDYIPLTKITAGELEAYGNSLIPLESDEFIIVTYKNFIKLLYTTILTINSTLYMWDLCAVSIALDLKCEQRYIIQNFDITPSGTIVTSTTTNNRSVLYNFISYYLFKTEIIDAIFANLK